MKTLFGTLIAVLGFQLACSAEEAGGEVRLTRMLQQSTLTLLREGNLRFAEGRTIHPNVDAPRRTEVATAGQEPMATVLACSDSREPVELVFDRGVGDLFVIRVAGNVAGLSELATMEYGVNHLGTTLLIVMGHSKCGAVTAAVKGAELHGHLPSLVSLIKPAADKAKFDSPEEQVIPRAIELNVWQQVENIIARSAEIRQAVVAGKVQILGAVYDITSGKISWLGQHPEMDRLIGDAKSLSEQPEAPAVGSVSAPVAPQAAVNPAHVKPEPEKPADISAHQPSAHDTTPARPVTRVEVANSHH